MNKKKIDKCHADLTKVFQKHKLTLGEILSTYGRLGYTLGASIEGYKGTGPSIETLDRLYHTQPTLGVSLMLQGLTVITWIDTVKTHGNSVVRNKTEDNQE